MLRERRLFTGRLENTFCVDLNIGLLSTYERRPNNEGLDVLVQVLHKLMFMWLNIIEFRYCHVLRTDR